MNLYWGDIHNHCGITYGFGSLDHALAAARRQLDFCAVIGHAMWPDMPERNADTAFLVDFHRKGFAKLRGGWEQVRSAVAEANRPGEFVTFQGYEMHSGTYGDHHFLSPDDALPLVEASSPAELVRALAPRRVIAIPHHIGYSSGYRGTNWDTFDGAVSPVVEVYSKHGCSVSDNSPFPYLHTMGPRNSGNTAFAGLRRGHRFGFVGSTDHHAGYPGSYGDGRVAVWAEEKTREAIWQAIGARRTYAVTGDKIACRFRLGQAEMGEETQVGGKRDLSLQVRGCDELQEIIVYKNLRPWRTIGADRLYGRPDRGNGRYKVRLEMGWGQSDEAFQWDGKLRVKHGRLVDAETCFRGRSVLAPTPEMRDDPDINKLEQRLLSCGASEAEWRCVSFKNPSTLHAATAALVFEIEGDAATTLAFSVNGQDVEVRLNELLQNSRTTYVKPYLSEAWLIHRAVPASAYTFDGAWEDGEAEGECDAYHVFVRQANGQCAWISPIYALS